MNIGHEQDVFFTLENGKTVTVPSVIRQPGMDDFHPLEAMNFLEIGTHVWTGGVERIVTGLDRNECTITLEDGTLTPITSLRWFVPKDGRTWLQVYADHDPVG